ncbi:MAG: GNAT family N-acetyltransferase [Microgenomates group bacterium]
MIAVSPHISVYKKPPKQINEQIKQLGYICFATKKLSVVEQKINQDQTIASKPEKFVVAVANGALLGRIKIFKRTSIFDNTHITIGGVGGVCVEPNVRNHGIGSRLLYTALAEIKKSNVDIALLIVDAKNKKLVALYQKFGFTLLNRNVTYTGKSGTIYSQKGAMIAPMRSKNTYTKICTAKTSLHIGYGNF